MFLLVTILLVPQCSYNLELSRSRIALAAPIANGDTKFKNFKRAMIFVNQVADVANEQDHHPDIFIHWNEVTLTFYTHAIKGLHDNDFIMAAKIEEL